MIETRLSPAFIPDSHLGSRKVDALVVEPPISTLETCLPLGPALLARSASRRGFHVEVEDWNKKYLNSRSDAASPVRKTSAVGDHGKDRVHIKNAVDYHLEKTGLQEEESFQTPDGANAARGMHYSFEAINRAVAKAKVSEYWGEWIDNTMSSREKVPPVVGVSVMGPEQVFPALVLMSAIKDRWPTTVTVMGGSHPTLLHREIRNDPRYTHDEQGRRIIDVVLPGHSEEAFSDLIATVAQGGYVSLDKTQVGELGLSKRFDYLPLFSEEQLGLYDPSTLTLPLQLTKGCTYGLCTHCTYPEIEPNATSRSGFQADRARDAISSLTEQFGVKKYSLKDSLFTLYWMRQLGEELLKNGPEDTRWSASTKAVRAFKNRAKDVASYGATTLELGVESIIPKSRDVIHKKEPSPREIEEIVLALAAEGVTPVVNLMFGIPGESEKEAQAQLDWFIHLQEQARQQGGAAVEGSLNMLLLTRGAPLATNPPKGVVLKEAAPWAYVHPWNEPGWRRTFSEKLAHAQLQEAE